MSYEHSKVRWRCRRGLLELDVLLERFFDQNYRELSRAEKKTFQALLDCTDQDLLNWLMNDQLPDNPELAALLLKIRRAN